MSISIETRPGGAARELKKIRKLIQDANARDREALRLGVASSALLTMLQSEETRVAALT